MPAAGDHDLIVPNLARLAAEGVDFRRAYTSYPVCCPSRAPMLTGKFPHAAGVPRNHMLLPLTEQTISAQLKRAGYRTGYVGKWHLDGHETPGFVPVARRRGFDYWAAYNVALYHLGDDPYELRNLVTVPTAAHKRDQLLTLLRRWMERISDRVLYTAPRNAAV